MECEATHNYKGQYEDELSLKAGDRVEVTADSKPLRHCETFTTFPNLERKKCLVSRSYSRCYEHWMDAKLSEIHQL